MFIENEILSSRPFGQKYTIHALLDHHGATYGVKVAA